MPDIVFTIPDEQEERVIAAINGRHPVPRDEEGNAEFTPNEWAKEYFKRLVIREVLAYERTTQGNKIKPDNTVISYSGGI